MVGGFSSAYDLVASSYGWTDEYIGELPLGRLRQITAAIQQRRFNDERTENSRFSWLARAVSSYVAAGYQLAEGEENEALKQAATLAYDDIEAAVMAAGPAAAKEPVAKEPRVGSYEKLMGAFQTK